jgi:aminopeptidase N
VLRSDRASRHGNATTEDFVALAEEVSDESLDDLFEAWLFQPNLPDLPATRAAATESATPMAG